MTLSPDPQERPDPDSPLLRARGRVKQLTVLTGWFGRGQAVVRAAAGVDSEFQGVATSALGGELGPGYSSVGVHVTLVTATTSPEARCWWCNVP